MANRPLLIKLILVNSLASVLPALTKTLDYNPAPVYYRGPFFFNTNVQGKLKRCAGTVAIGSNAHEVRKFLIERASLRFP